MNIRLNPHSEQLLKEQLAQGSFHSPEEVIERALETLREREQSARAVDLAEFDATLEALREGSEKIPALPDEAFTRAGIYREHIDVRSRLSDRYQYFAAGFQARRPQVP